MFIKMFIGDKKICSRHIDEAKFNKLSSTHDRAMFLKVITQKLAWHYRRQIKKTEIIPIYYIDQVPSKMNNYAENDNRRFNGKQSGPPKSTPGTNGQGHKDEIF